MSPQEIGKAPAPNGDQSETNSHHAAQSDVDSIAGVDPYADVPHPNTEPVEAIAEPSSWARIDLTQYLNGTHKAAEATILTRDDGQALIYPGLVHSVHGESESGKSLIMQIECVRQISAGHDVLFLDFESDPESVARRLVEFGAEPADIIEHFDYRQPETNLANVAASADWEAILKNTYTLAVIDGVTDCLGVFGKSTLDNDDIATWMRKVPKTLASHTGAAVVLIDHVVKDKESRGRFSVGGQQKMNALTGAAYTVEVKEHLGKGSRGVIALRIGKDRPGSIRANCGPFRVGDRTQLAATITIDSTGPGAPVVVIAAPQDDTGSHTGGFRPTVLMERVSRFVQDHGSPGVREINAAVTGNKQAIATAIQVLITEGYISVTTGTGRAKPHTHIKPYLQVTDPQSDKYQGVGDTQWRESA